MAAEAGGVLRIYPQSTWGVGWRDYWCSNNQPPITLTLTAADLSFQSGGSFSGPTTLTADMSSVVCQNNNQQATAPAAPTNLTATAGDGSATVTFTAGSDGGSAITNYKYSLNGGSSWSALSPSDTTSPITITGLTNGTTYSISIRAVNAVGDGQASQSVSVTPQAQSGNN